MRLVFILLLALLTAGQQESVEFINPPAPGAVGDYSLNPTFVLGSSVNVRWTPIAENISLVLYQSLPDVNFEHIFQNERDISSFRWTVGTQKDLSDSEVFFFQIFIEGVTSPIASSHYFNITRSGSNGGASSSTSSTSTSSTSSTQTTSLTSSTQAPSLTGTATSTSAVATASTVPTPSTGGLGTGAKVGLGIGIPVAVVLGVVAGWLFFGRRKKQNEFATENNPAQDGKYDPNVKHQQPSIAEAPNSELYNRPVELSYTNYPRQ